MIVIHLTENERQKTVAVLTGALDAAADMFEFEVAAEIANIKRKIEMAEEA